MYPALFSISYLESYLIIIAPKSCEKYVEFGDISIFKTTHNPLVLFTFSSFAQLYPNCSTLTVFHKARMIMTI